MSENSEIEMPTAAMADAFLVVQSDEAQGVSEQVALFGRYLVDHYLGPGTSETMSAERLLNASVLALYDLARGVDGMTREPISSELVGLESDAYEKIMRLFPALVQAVLPPDFAAGFEAHRERVLGPTRPLAENEEAAGPEDGEVITEPITTARQAYEQIVRPATQGVMAIDWSDILPEPLAVTELELELFQLILLSSGVNIDSPLMLLSNAPGGHQSLLASLPDTHKHELPKDAWLGLLEGEVDSEHATAIKDLLFLRGLEWVVDRHGLDQVRPQMRLFQETPSVRRAAIRLREYQVAHPERAGINRR